MKNLIVYAFCLSLFSLSYGQQADGQSSVLIVDGFSNHDLKQTSSVSRDILEETGMFSVSVSTTPSSAQDPGWQSWNPEFAEYDVVVQNCNNINNKNLRWPTSIEKELENYVRNGGGLYILHSANNSFSEWDQYNLMIGMGWRKKDEGDALEISDKGTIIRIPSGEGENTSHGARFEALIQVLDEHVLNEGYPDSWRTPNMELYLHPRGPAKNVTVLSYAKDPLSGRSWPVEWLVQYGKGWVYNSSMGHLWKGESYPESYRCIGFQTTMIRTVEWLATGKVSYPVPENFPTATSISLNPQ